MGASASRPASVLRLDEPWYDAIRYLGGWWSKPWVVRDHRPGSIYGSETTEIRRFRFRWSAVRWVRICEESDEVIDLIGEHLGWSKTTAKGDSAT